MKIFKYHLGMPETKLQLPKGATVLSAGAQNDEIFIWVEFNPGLEKETEERVFEFIPTGVNFNGWHRKFIGTVLLAEGRLVFHVYEVEK